MNEIEHESHHIFKWGVESPLPEENDVQVLAVSVVVICESIDFLDNPKI
jgi:hypothetical protein